MFLEKTQANDSTEKEFPHLIPNLSGEMDI